MLKCLRCGRALIRFALSVETKDGMVGWWPDCARRAFKRDQRERKKKAERDARTVDWVNEIGSAVCPV